MALWPRGEPCKAREAIPVEHIEDIKITCSHRNAAGSSMLVKVKSDPLGHLHQCVACGAVVVDDWKLMSSRPDKMMHPKHVFTK